VRTSGESKKKASAVKTCLVKAPIPDIVLNLGWKEFCSFLYRYSSIVIKIGTGILKLKYSRRSYRLPSRRYSV
jgi:hypothetical protein